ncbi:MAG: ATP-binding protein [Actinophytocola sp.]|uniref:sensor histidine kinase n=1 Tax=Actinophytocola sp. TaxID=1872138 RepID=UPI003C716DA8
MSVRTRLALTFGGLFLLAGVILLLVNYALVSQALPQSSSYAQNVVSDHAGGEPTTTVTIQAVDGAVAGYRESAIQTVLLISGIALLLVGAMAALLGWLMAGRVMRPVERITATARRLEAERMDRRINLDGPHDELKELADTFDGMLDRLAASFDSQRRFVANASHELRTPLAVQRTIVEVAMADPAASPELMRLGAHLLHTNERTERLIDGLLVLARSDRGLTSRQPVRLDHVVAAVLDGASTLSDEQGVTVASRLGPRFVAGDPVLLERLVTNLVHNGIHYNEPGGSVLVEVGEWPALVVTNTGPHVPPAAVAGLFEPFRRLDADRTAHRAGAGLGLSIARSVVHAHDGEVSAVPNPGGGLRVSVNLPFQQVGVQRPTGGPRVALGAHGGD